MGPGVVSPTSRSCPKPLLLPPGNTRVPFCSCSGSPRLGPGSSPASPVAPHFTPVLSPAAVCTEPSLSTTTALWGFPTASVDKAPRGASWWRRNVCRAGLWFHKAGRGIDVERRQEIDSRHRLWPLNSILKTVREVIKGVHEYLDKNGYCCIGEKKEINSMFQN